jgi:NAD(P)-dependent dehydrogenase (short-subunit alcohol dehydrogenase family)
MNNKIAVITGGARMIGRATAAKLAKQGYDILIHTGGKSLEEAKKTSEMVIKLTKKCEIVTGDLLTKTGKKL